MKKLVSLILAIVMIFCCGSMVFGFTDVNSECEYTDSINYMFEKGYISGYDDGTFKPDNYISFHEFATLIVKASDREDFKIIDKAFWSKSYLDFVRINHWLSYENLKEEDFEKCKEYISKDLVLKALLNMFDVKPYNYRLYGLEFADIDLCADQESRNAAVAAYLLGLIEKDENNNLGVTEGVTRGEICEWIYVLKNNLTEEKLSDLKPDILDELNIEFLENQSESTYTYVVNELGDIPFVVLQKFADLGWTLKISDRLLMDIYSYPGLDVSGASGVCDYDKKTIYVTYDILMNIGSTLRHEMGHFVEKAFLYDSKNQAEIVKLFNFEKEALADFTHREYCKTNKSEFFAEAFYVYTAWNSGTERMKNHLYYSLPMICKFFDDFYMRLDVIK